VVRSAHLALAVLASSIAAAPAGAQVTLRPEAMPDLEQLELTAPELECTWRPGVQLGRIDAVVGGGGAALEVALGARPSRSSRLAITASTGATRETHPAFGALAVDGRIGLGPATGAGADVAVHGRLERSAVDYRPAPVPMRPPGSLALHELDGELWLTRRHGDYGWAFMPLAYGIEHAVYGPAGKPLGTAAIDRALTQRLGAGVGIRAYENELADGTIVARVDLARTELGAAANGQVIEQVAASLDVDGGAATSLTPRRVPLLPDSVKATALAVDLAIGFAAMHHVTGGERDTIFTGTAGMVATSAGGTTAGAGVSVGPGYTVDGAHLARLWRIEGRYGTCAGRLCGGAQVALSWLEPLLTRAVPSIAEHQIDGRVTYAVTRRIRVGLDYRVSHRGAWDRDFAHAIGAVLELGGSYGGPRPQEVPHGTSTISVCN